MPKLWTDTIAEHRSSVRDAVLDATAELIAEVGPASVTMSAVAVRTGIGRATVYKYFPDVESVLLAWHERQVEQHLRRIEEARDHLADPGERLVAVLTTYATGLRHEGGPTAALHRGGHIHNAQHRLLTVLRALLDDAVSAQIVRADIPTDELARFCLAAMGAARELTDPAGVPRLVELVMSGLRPPP